MTAIVTSGVNVNPNVATQLVVTTQPPTSIAAGTKMQIVVTARDAFGNTALITASLNANPGGSTPGGMLAVKAVNGVALFSDLWLNKVGVGYKWQFAAAGLSVGVTNSLAVTFAAASQLVFSAPPPTTVNAGAPFSLTVRVLDVFGNLVTNFNKQAMLTVTATTPGATRGGNTLNAGVSIVNGMATFSNLSLNNRGVSYKLAILAPGLPTLTTDWIKVS